MRGKSVPMYSAEQMIARRVIDGSTWFRAVGDALATYSPRLAPDEVDVLSRGTRTLADNGRAVLTAWGMRVADLLLEGVDEDAILLRHWFEGDAPLVSACGILPIHYEGDYVNPPADLPLCIDCGQIVSNR